MDYSVSNIGLCIWVGEDRFVINKVDIQNPEIAATFNDIRGYMSYTVPVNTFALEFTRTYKVYTSYRPVCDRQGRPAFLAVSLFVPYGITIHKLTSLLEGISLKYYKNHYGLGGIMKQGEQVIPELYTREVDGAAMSKDPDGTWTGRASKQISKPKILPFTDISVVESFFEHPHRPAFHNCQEVLFIPSTYLGAVDSGISLPRSTPEDYFAQDGADAGQEAKGFLIERDNKLPYSVNAFSYNGIEQAYWSPYLRHGSVISFVLSKSRYDVDLSFEGTLASAIEGGYIQETAEGYKFSPSLSFKPRQKTITFQIPDLYSSNAMFVMVAVSGDHHRQNSILGGRAQFPFIGEELGYRWSFFIEEKNYEYTVHTGVPDDINDTVSIDNCRLIDIIDHTSKNITLDFGPTVPFNLKRNAKPENLSGKWLLPSNLTETCFKLDHNSYFEKNVSGIGSGRVEISLDRIGYQLCVPKAVWNAMNKEQQRTSCFKLNGTSWSFANSNKASDMIVVAEAKDAAQGTFTTNLNGEQMTFQFGCKVNEQDDLFMIVPAIIELSIARGCSVKLGNNAVLQEGTVILPQGLVNESMFQSQGYSVQHVGREDNDGGSFPGYSISSPGSRISTSTGKILGQNQDPSAGAREEKMTFGRNDVQYFVNGISKKCSKFNAVGDFIPTAEGLYLSLVFDLKKTRNHRKNRGYDVVERKGDRGERCYYFTSKHKGGAHKGGSGLPLWLWITIITAVLALGVGTYLLIRNNKENKVIEPQEGMTTGTEFNNNDTDATNTGNLPDDSNDGTIDGADEFNTNLVVINRLVNSLYTLDATKNTVDSLKKNVEDLSPEIKTKLVENLLLADDSRVIKKYPKWNIDEFIKFHEVMFSGNYDTFKESYFLVSGKHELDPKWEKYAPTGLWGTGEPGENKAFRHFYNTNNWKNFGEIISDMQNGTLSYSVIIEKINKTLQTDSKSAATRSRSRGKIEISEGEIIK